MEFDKIISIAKQKENIETRIEELSESSSKITSEEDLDTIIMICGSILKDVKAIKDLLK